MAATTEEVPRPYGRGTSSVVSFVVAMNRVDVVDLVVDLVDVDLDVDLVDVDLVDVDLVDVDLERAIDKKEIKTRAPDVRLTHRLVHSASFVIPQTVFSQSDHLQCKIWKMRWLSTFASTKKNDGQMILNVNKVEVNNFIVNEVNVNQVNIK